MYQIVVKLWSLTNASGDAKQSCSASRVAERAKRSTVRVSTHITPPGGQKTGRGAGTPVHGAVGSEGPSAWAAGRPEQSASPPGSPPLCYSGCSGPQDSL